MTRQDALITVAELREAQAGENPPVILDVRWTLGAPAEAGRAAYDGGHIPGAIYVDLDVDLADHTNDDPRRGRHPLPTTAQIQASARRWGLHSSSAIVLVDDNASQGAARGWWVLRWAGFTTVRVLDGALAAWREEGLPLESSEPAVAPSDITLTTGHMPILTADDAGQIAREGLLLDARPEDRFRGENETRDPRAGHIPGAVNAPTAGNLDGQRFASDDALRTRYEGLGVRGGTVGVSCGSGVTACHDLLALSVIGVSAALYPGSWSAWANDPDRPVQLGV
ncbi:sulfurtransferase [Microbacterium amylolyticum]|uniref:Thiosulfate/3-mercaptopyruvate sulfurtransferase n=1 Tax=Microbacterium amylolyticum TaxID=936337 RepID=A0ABS4ZGT7_9MICO|nr:sulfurtransferase [Microbacterium amylolyticum]MBP2436499.1 thiosulfate/3-mercaptopyruvate sulfurtransferase [Microbacterium amylolyticum]